MKYILTLVSIDNGSPGYSIINFNLLIRSFFFLHNRETTASYALGFIYVYISEKLGFVSFITVQSYRVCK